jgi:hypothetical protein
VTSLCLYMKGKSNNLMTLLGVRLLIILSRTGGSATLTLSPFILPEDTVFFLVGVLTIPEPPVIHNFDTL